MFILTSCILLTTILIIWGIVAQKNYRLSSTLIIEKPIHEVFSFIKMLQNQVHYNKNVMADPNIQIELTGEDGTIGCQSTWKSNIENLGAGRQEIISIHENKSITIEFHFEKPLAGAGSVLIELAAIDAKTTELRSTFRSYASFPSNIFLMYIKKMLFKDLIERNNLIKSYLEKH